jgi:putative peptidoglycan lipid II flippase
MPCLAAFFVFPDAIMEGLFARGAFNVEAARAAASVLVAYAAGLPAFVVLRTVTPLFHSKGDTRTPVVATAAAMVCNLVVKFGLIVGLNYGVEGLALGTAVGVWVNVLMLGGFALARGMLAVDARLVDNALRFAGATLLSGLLAALAAQPLLAALAGVTFERPLVYVAILGFLTLTAYALTVLGLGWKR